MAASVQAIPKPATEESGNFFNRMPWYYQMGILVGLTVLLIYAAHVVLYSDTRAETEKIRGQIEQLKASNSQGNIIRQNLAATEQTLKEKRAEIDQLRDFLPDQVEISKVYDNIKDFAREERLDMKKFAEVKEIPAEYYTAQPIQVEVAGTYDSLGRFFSKLGFYTRILSVTDVNVKQAADNLQLRDRSIEGSFTITAYYISPANLEKLTMRKPALPAGAPKPAAH
ncbi:MAG TPA: type 4a pilus biogenesis protein PilO [Blastocatellia bacterium]|nr:type 4a pilus biogenesis protein PilO [Blastocatellia bacterium]